jgi:hypothetical protein
MLKGTLMIHHCHTTSIAQTTPETVLPLDPLPCPQGGAVGRPAVDPGCGPHIASARCWHCGRFFQWLSQYTPAERQARRQLARRQAIAHRLPSQGQLAYLAPLGNDGMLPVTMLEASERIDTLKRRAILV